MGTQTLTPTMLAAIEFAKQNGGALVRQPGGFWVRPEDDKSYRTNWYGTPTVEAIVRRGLGKYTQWQGSARGRSFPIRMEVLEATDPAAPAA